MNGVQHIQFTAQGLGVLLCGFNHEIIEPMLDPGFTRQVDRRHDRLGLAPFIFRRDHHRRRAFAQEVADPAALGNPGADPALQTRWGQGLQLHRMGKERATLGGGPVPARPLCAGDQDRAS